MAKTIIIMTGSVRPQSVSEALLPLVQKTVEATGAQVHIANLKELALPFFDGNTVLRMRSFRFLMRQCRVGVIW